MKKASSKIGDFCNSNGLWTSPRTAARLALGLFLSLTSLSATAAPEVGYRLAFPQATQHYVEVEAEFPTQGATQLELFMPVWTPGSYLVREYARNVEAFQATAGEKKLTWHKSRKNRWAIDCGGQSSVKISYRVYCRELSVRTSLVESDFALLTPAGVFMAEVGNFQHPYKVNVTMPPAWKECLSGLPGTPGNYSAANFDELIDSPILVGNPAVYRFQVEGTDHVLVNQGEGGVWDGPGSAKDVAKIVGTAYKLWGSFAYAAPAPHSYTFFNILGTPGGGLEHHNSTVLMAGRFARRMRKDYLGWLSLVSHEYFHNWNVKRLRPAALGPFDYENENYTPSLWIAEGLTAYYDNLLVRRSGFSSHAEYLEILSKEIESLQNNPGRLVQSVASSSYDAWIKFYRPDENSVNTGVSYYTKGPLVGFLLDAEIRKRTGGKFGLDEVMRRAYKLYAGDRGYTEAQFRAVASEVAGAPMDDFFTRNVDTAGELDYTPALAFYGLRFKAPPANKSKDPDPAWLGSDMDIAGGRLVVKTIRRGTPAYESGLNVEDEVIAFDGQRVLPDKEKFEDRLKHYKPGETAQILVARREQLITLPVKFGKKPVESWALEVDPNADAQCKAHLEAWLGPDGAIR